MPETASESIPLSDLLFCYPLVFALVCSSVSWRTGIRIRCKWWPPVIAFLVFYCQPFNSLFAISMLHVKPLSGSPSIFNLNFSVWRLWSVPFQDCRPLPPAWSPWYRSVDENCSVAALIIHHNKEWIRKWRRKINLNSCNNRPSVQWS